MTAREFSFPTSVTPVERRYCLAMSSSTESPRYASAAPERDEDEGISNSILLPDFLELFFSGNPGYDKGGIL